MTPELAAVERVEILTLQDNYIDLTSGDGSAVVQRAIPLKGDQVSVSLLAEHGFSALVRVHAAGKVRSLLFDFGFSQHGAAFNADALGIDLRQVEALALSHGHMDHTGGLEALSQRIARPGITLTLHPEAYRTPRYMKLGESFKAYFPPLTRERIDAAGITVQESSQPRLLLDETILFLGQIPRRTDFEKGAPNLCCEKDGVEMPDSFEDDTALVMHLKDKGLVVLSGLRPRGDHQHGAPCPGGDRRRPSPCGDGRISSFRSGQAGSDPAHGGGHGGHRARLRDPDPLHRPRGGSGLRTGPAPGLHPQHERHANGFRLKIVVYAA